MRLVTDKNFDKSFKKQPLKIKNEFEKRISLFVEDMNHPILKTHKLSGKLKDLWSFSVSGDIRVIFDKSRRGVIILVDIGSHSELYS